MSILDKIFDLGLRRLDISLFKRLIESKNICEESFFENREITFGKWLGIEPIDLPVIEEDKEVYVIFLGEKIKIKEKDNIVDAKKIANIILNDISYN